MNKFIDKNNSSDNPTIKYKLSTSSSNKWEGIDVGPPYKTKTVLNLEKRTDPQEVNGMGLTSLSYFLVNELFIFFGRNKRSISHLAFPGCINVISLIDFPKLEYIELSEGTNALLIYQRPTLLKQIELPETINEARLPNGVEILNLENITKKMEMEGEGKIEMVRQPSPIELRTNDIIGNGFREFFNRKKREMIKREKEKERNETLNFHLF